MGIYPRPDDGPPPALKAPTGTTDTHMHIFDDRFPQAPGGPVQPSASVAEYEVVRRRLGIDRVVVVQANAYRTDNSCLEDALAQMGARARGVAAVTPDVADAELERLTGLGVRGARIMDLGGGPVGTDRLPAVAGRVGPFGWHTIVQFDGREMAEKESLLASLPGTYIIDHAGKFLTPVGVDSEPFRALLRLVDRGNCYVKLSACYETSQSGPPDYADVGALSKALASHAPERMLWASNWPHVGATHANHPDDARMLDLLLDWAPDADVRHRILVGNPAELYGFS
jgi:D-galactarolactone isomerase